MGGFSDFYKKQNQNWKDSSFESKALGGLTTAQGFLSNESSGIDTSGRTDVSNISNKSITGGAGKVIGDTGKMALAGLKFGGPIGALAFGLGGLIKSLGGQKKRREELARAKNNLKSRRRFKSRKAINDMSASEGPVDEENVKYIENLKNSPSYARFKRRENYKL